MLTQDDINKIADYIADWWGRRLKQGDIDAFKASLKASTVEQLSRNTDWPRLYLECDYDPKGPLLDAVRAAGLECSGSFFSARGILPQKHSTDIFPMKDANPEFEEEAAPARLITKEGYGNWNDPIPLDDIISGRAARRLVEGGGNGD